MRLSSSCKSAILQYCAVSCLHYQEPTGPSSWLLQTPNTTAGSGSCILSPEICLKASLIKPKACAEHERLSQPQMNYAGAINLWSAPTLVPGSSHSVKARSALWGIWHASEQMLQVSWPLGLKPDDMQGQWKERSLSRFWSILAEMGLTMRFEATWRLSLAAA